MISIIISCVLMGASIPGPSQPDSWRVLMDGELYSPLICLEIDEEVTFQLVPVNDGVTDRTNPSPYQTVRGVPNADADDDGVIDFADFGILSDRFGECNDGQQVIDCQT